MKGFYIFEAETHKEAVDCLELANIVQSFVHEFSPTTITEEVKMHALVTKETKTKCSPDDTYDFETGALIALMKMCGVDKVVRAFNEAFPKETHNTYITKFERELNTLKKDFDKVKDLKDFYKKNYEDVKEHYGKLGDRNKYLIEDINKKLEYIKEKDEEIKNLKKEKEQIIVARSILNNKLLEENSRLKYIKSCNESTIESLKNTRDLLINKNNELIEENEKLKLDCIKLQHGYVDTDNVSSGYWDGDILDIVFLPGRACGKQYKALVEMFKKLDKKKVQEAYKEAYGDRVIWCTSQPEVHPLSTAVLEGVSYLNKKFKTYSIEEWLYKIPTRREKKWERILELRKENDVIIEVKKEDVKTFLHEIEDKIPEITWASDVKIFEAKGTIKDIYEELMTHNRIYFRLSKKNKLSYSSDLNTYLFINLDMIAYLPPMRWDLFKKGRLAVKVNYDNYKEFYEACEKELGKKPSTVYPEEYTVSICKKDGLFEVFTVEHQKNTGKKIVNWEDVRENKTTTEDPYDTWKW